mgnify:CR=1 FL=1
MYKVIFIGILCLFLINFIITYMIVYGGNKKKSAKEILTENEEQMNAVKNIKIKEKYKNEI